MRDTVHEIAVVGKQDQSFRIGVQSSHRNQTHIGNVHQVRHLARRVFILDGADIADRLEQSDIVAARGRGDGLTVHLNGLRVRIDAGAGDAHYLPVHGHSPQLDKILGVPP